MHRLVTLATERQRQEDHYEFEANLAYMVLAGQPGLYEQQKHKKGKGTNRLLLESAISADRAGFLSCGWREEKQD